VANSHFSKHLEERPVRKSCKKKKKNPAHSKLNIASLWIRDK